jgi:hypothetical protein
MLKLYSVTVEVEFPVVVDTEKHQDITSMNLTKYAEEELWEADVNFTEIKTIEEAYRRYRGGADRILPWGNIDEDLTITEVFKHNEEEDGLTEEERFLAIPVPGQQSLF